MQRLLLFKVLPAVAPLKIRHLLRAQLPVEREILADEAVAAAATRAVEILVEVLIHEALLQPLHKPAVLLTQRKEDVLPDERVVKIVLLKIQGKVREAGDYIRIVIHCISLLAEKDF